MQIQRIQMEEDEGIRILRLVRGRGNALDLATLEELHRCFTSGGKAAPLVLCASGRSFCTGLDLQENLDRQRPQMALTMEAFHRTLRACFLYPAPVVAALGGHALAGGALLALACDHRVLSSGGARFGIHGVHLGVSYPQVAVEILRHQLPRPLLEELLYAGHIYDSERALAVGLVDELVEAAELEERARSEARRRALAGPAFYAESKQRLRAAAARRLDPICADTARRWLDQWFDPETRRRLARARDALGGGGGEKPAA